MGRCPPTRSATTAGFDSPRSTSSCAAVAVAREQTIEMGALVLERVHRRSPSGLPGSWNAPTGPGDAKGGCPAGDARSLCGNSPEPPCQRLSVAGSLPARSTHLKPPPVVAMSRPDARPCWRSAVHDARGSSAPRSANELRVRGRRAGTFAQVQDWPLPTLRVHRRDRQLPRTSAAGCCGVLGCADLVSWIAARRERASRAPATLSSALPS